MKFKFILLFLFIIFLSGCQTQSIQSINFDFDIEIKGQGISIYQQTVTIESGGKYVISGSTQQGQLIVDAKNQNVELILDHLSLTSSTSSPIYIKNASVVTITLPQDTSNTLSYLNQTNNGAAIQSEADVVLQGLGQLMITSHHHAITSNKTLMMNGGVYKIQADLNGIQAKEALTIIDGEFDIDSKKACMTSIGKEKKEGQLVISQGIFVLKSLEMGIEAKQNLTIKNGRFDIESLQDAFASHGNMTLYNGEYHISADKKGIYSKEKLKIVEGIYEIKDSEEGIVSNALEIINGYMNIVSLMQGIQTNNGEFSMNNGIIMIDSGDVGLYVNGNAYLTGGKVYINGPSEPNVHALQINQACTIESGTLVALEKDKIILNTLQQPSFYMHLNKIYKASSKVIVKDNNDQMILEYSTIKDYQSFLVSSDKLQHHTLYHVYIDQELIQTFSIELDNQVKRME